MKTRFLVILGLGSLLFQGCAACSEERALYFGSTTAFGLNVSNLGGAKQSLIAGYGCREAAVMDLADDMQAYPLLNVTGVQSGGLALNADRTTSFVQTTVAGPAACHPGAATFLKTMHGK